MRPEHRIIDGFEIFARRELLPFQQLGDVGNADQRNRARLPLAMEPLAVMLEEKFLDDREQRIVIDDSAEARS